MKIMRKRETFGNGKNGDIEIAALNMSTDPIERDHA
jgi:hypothetical protein